MKINRTRITYISLAIVSIFLCQMGVAIAQVQYQGVNLAGAEFGDANLPGIYNTDYTYPTHEEVDYFIGKGMNVFRLPFRWERLQHHPYEVFDNEELDRINNFVNYATSNNASVILDPHNYARYYGNIIGSSDLSSDAFEDFWQQLANHFKSNDHVIFGLMNEPHDMATELWLADANAAISAIRATGATNLILIPGNAFSGAHSWNDNGYGTPNGLVMQDIIDPGNNYAFEVHQYLDSDSSGTSPDCISVTIGSSRLQNFTDWLHENNKRGFLGEFASGIDPVCLNALDDMLAYMGSNSDVWLGWTYWAAGPWWGEYMFTLEPEADGSDRAQMAIIEKYLGFPGGDGRRPAPPSHLRLQRGQRLFLPFQ